MLYIETNEFQKNFDKYLSYVQKGIEIIITKNGNEIARLVSNNKKTYISDSFRGVLKNDYNLEDIRKEKTDQLLNK